MKIQSIQQQNNSFKGFDISKASNFVANHPILTASIAGSSAVAQKLVMSASEASIGPAMDIAIGKIITKATDEKDGRTNQSSKVQAVRTFSQTVGGTISGVIIRFACIAGLTYALTKVGGKAGTEIAKKIDKSGNKNSYEIQKNASALGKSMGGVLATLVMMFTNFVVDVPIINFINKKVSDLCLKEDKKPENKQGGVNV